MIDLRPSVCNVCGGKVIYTSNSLIYKREYGSGRMYYCTSCGAYVGTHIWRPQEAFGILANEEMRALKIVCHAKFDAQWVNKPSRKEKKKARKLAYKNLARKLGIAVEDCHFGYFDIDMLNKAYQVLCELD